MITKKLCILTSIIMACCYTSLASSASKTIILWPDKGDVTGTVKVTKGHHINTTRVYDIKSPSMKFYPAKTEEKAPVVIICPGGGYSYAVVDKEGTEAADWLNSIGIHAVVLWYTVPKKREAALKDIQRAMGLVRKNAKEWNVDPERCGVMGFSAGGHLAARLSNNYEKRAYTKIDEADSISCKPDFSILIYPAYLATKDGKVVKEMPVSKATPATFIVHAESDSNFLEGVRLYTDLLKEKGVPVDLNLFKKGGHGFGLRNKRDPISKWPQLCEKWLNNLFNK